MQPLVAIPAILALLYRARSRNSLTPLGILTAGLTAAAHAVHPWSVFFVLLGVFFLAGTAVTKVKHEYKATLTASSTGGANNPSAPHPRTATQVLANSFAATVLILVHAFLLRSHPSQTCLSQPHNIISMLPYGIMSHYAAVAADTFSSELGILSTSPPFLITDFVGLIYLAPRRVPRGTNGGVTSLGLAAGAGGAAVVAVVSVLLTSFCSGWTLAGKLWLFMGITACGTCGSVVDSVMGGLLQASVIDTKTGKVIEGDGGEKVAFLISQERRQGQPGRTLLVGADVLSNNGVNFLMATVMSLVPIVVMSVFI